MTEVQEHLTVEGFIERAWQGGLVRCLVEKQRDPRYKFRAIATTVTIHVYSAEQDVDHNRNLIEVVYHCAEPYADPSRPLESVTIKSRLLGNSLGEATWGDDIVSLLSEWSLSELRRWASSREPIVALCKNEGGNISEIPSTDFYFDGNRHLARFWMRLILEIENKCANWCWLSSTLADLSRLIVKQGAMHLLQDEVSNYVRSSIKTPAYTSPRIT